MSDGRPEALLKSALEKIVYFEARSEQLQGEAATLRAEADQLRRDLATAAQREVALRRQIAELDVELGRAHREREESGRLLEALREERRGLLGKVLEAARIQHAGAEEPDFDLAGFIAELRSEALAAGGSPASATLAALEGRAARADPAPVAVSRAAPPAPARPGEFVAVLAPPPGDSVLAASAPGPTRASPAPIPTRPSLADTAVESARELRAIEAPAGAVALSPAGRPVSAAFATPHGAAAVMREAERLHGQGRLGIPASPRYAEESLFGFSVRELASPDLGARVRAAARLRALDDRAAAPALAAALHAERDPDVLVALLDAFRVLATREGTAVVAPLLGSPEPTVRIAALRALVGLDPDAAPAHLARAAHDADPSVRRRAALLAVSLGPDGMLELAREVTRDPDPDVRKLAVLAAGAAGGEAARASLLSALDDVDAGVRRAAARSLSRLLGVELGRTAELPDEERRREIRRLAKLPAAPLGLRLADPAPVEDTGLVRNVALPGPSPFEAPGEPDAPVVAVAVAPVLAAASPPPEPEPRVARGAPELHSDEALCRTIAHELQAAMRGRTLEDLATQLGVPGERVVEAAALLTARGQVVRRGAKLFVA